MQIIDKIRARFINKNAIISDQRAVFAFDGFGFSSHNFSDLIWYNICDLETDLIEDVKITFPATLPPLSDAAAKSYAWRAFVYAWGKTVLQRLYDEGFVVIGWDGRRFWQMGTNEYDVAPEGFVTYVHPHNPVVEPYVMRSATYLTRHKSDKMICRGFLKYLDDALNSSATICRRLGAVVIASPKNLTNAPTPIVLTEETKEKLQKDMQEDYGSLSKQSQIMLLPREMAFQTINLAGLDVKMTERVKMAILAIVDRIKIPANQVAIIDAQNSRQLANGSEIREGDKLKYKTFRRLFERSFADMARAFNIEMEYEIDGEPIDKQGEVSAD